MKLIRPITLLLLCTLMLMSTACTQGPESEQSTTDPAQTITNPQEQTTEAQTTAEQTTQGEQETMSEFVMKDIRNPIAPTGADPWVIRHGDKYYYCYASYVWFYGGVAVAELDSPDQLGSVEGKQVYTAPTEDTTYSFEYWAPELHYLNGEWYIYVAADDGQNENHLMCVLKGTSQDPTDPFEFVGVITDPSDKWAIDGTVMQLNGELYFIWSGWEGDVNVAQNIYIAHMSDPCTIDSERVCLSTPKYSWEKKGEPYVNEGPAVLQHEGKTFVAYSASGSWTDDYCLGLLTLTGEDPLNPEHWEKSTTPVFKKRTGVAYGPDTTPLQPLQTAAFGWYITPISNRAQAGKAARYGSLPSPLTKTATRNSVSPKRRCSSLSKKRRSKVFFQKCEFFTAAIVIYNVTHTEQQTKAEK